MSRRSPHSSALNGEKQHQIKVISGRYLRPSKNAKQCSKRLNAQSNEYGKCYGLTKIPTPATDAKVICMTLQETISRMTNQLRPFVIKRNGSDDIGSFDMAAIGPPAKKKWRSYVHSYPQDVDIEEHICKKKPGSLGIQ